MYILFKNSESVLHQHFIFEEKFSTLTTLINCHDFYNNSTHHYYRYNHFLFYH